MATLINRKLGTRNGCARIFLEGQKLAREGYLPGGRYDSLVDDKNRLILTMSEHGRYKVSKRTLKNRTDPVIDINRAELSSLFDGVEMVRCIVSKGKIIITAHFQEKRVNERVQRLIKKLETGEPLRIGSCFHGGGIMDKSIHHGFESVGVKTKIGVAVEIESKYLDASLANNPELWDADSIPMETPIQSLDLSGTGLQLDVVCGGIPCTGASRSGRSKNRIQHAEDHEEAGALFFNFLNFIQAVNPGVIIAENVPEYANSASMAVVRSVLGSLGYEVQERILSGSEFGAIEDRQRLCIVGLSKGLEGVFNIGEVPTVAEVTETVGDIIEPFESIPEEAWKTYDYLAKKEDRDAANGKGFKRQQVTESATRVGTIGRGYNKARSTEPFLQHPYINGLTRLFTPTEHARLKKIPESVVNGLSATIAHEILGQSVIFPLFSAIASSIGTTLTQMAGIEDTTPKTLAA